MIKIVQIAKSRVRFLKTRTKAGDYVMWICEISEIQLARSSNIQK